MMQSYNRDYGDWVDVEDVTNLPNKTRLLATVETAVLATPLDHVNGTDTDLNAVVRVSDISSMDIPPLPCLICSTQVQRNPGPDTEDDASVDCHLKTLADQEKLPAVKQQKSVIRDAMGMTLADRRKLNIQYKATLGQIKDIYPTLFHEEQALIYIL
ncbi:hypothetical protein LSH36_388g02005 [Paralvinella palmiformis]|uniref:Uncharacterized protein n=1 Tax=Paralvinella palmiformis TaxID=53620 RepID=A0AAD9JCU4_9ANNE|nr:hypothetical protein LSH36_388g02005 [Paralvinella palmiformis]